MTKTTHYDTTYSLLPLAASADCFSETQIVIFTVGHSPLSFFDTEAHVWRTEPGTFHTHIAAAADILRQRTPQIGVR